jgi:hypothetical protein
MKLGGEITGWQRKPDPGRQPERLTQNELAADDAALDGDGCGQRRLAARQSCPSRVGERRRGLPKRLNQWEIGHKGSMV